MLWKRLNLTLVLVFLTIGLDQATKYWATHVLKGAPTQSYLSGTVLLMYAENTGAWGSMGSGLSDMWRFWLLTIMPMVFLFGLLLYTLKKAELQRYEVICYALVIGGGVGNLIDRALYGFVVDFMYVGYRGIGTNIFNVADMVIMTGVIALVILQYAMRERLPASKDSPAPGDNI